MEWLSGVVTSSVTEYWTMCMTCDVAVAVTVTIVQLISHPSDWQTPLQKKCQHKKNKIVFLVVLNNIGTVSEVPHVVERKRDCRIVADNSKKKICKCIYRALHSEQDTPTTKVAYFFLYVAQHNKSVSVVQTMHLTRNLGNNHKIG